MNKSFAIALAVFGIAGVSHANWDAKEQNALEMQIAKQNAVMEFVRYVGEQRGQELSSNDYVAEVKLASATIRNAEESLPATFEVTLYAREKDGSVSHDSVSAELTCERDHVRQIGRFTRVTPILCKISR